MVMRWGGRGGRREIKKETAKLFFDAKHKSNEAAEVSGKKRQRERSGRRKR
jgi:hypothetical protein